MVCCLLWGSALYKIAVLAINLTGAGFDFSFRLLDEGFIILSATSYSFSSAFIKKFSQDDDPVMLSGYQFILGGAVMIITGLLGDGKTHTVSIGGIVMLSYRKCRQRSIAVYQKYTITFLNVFAEPEIKNIT